MEEWAAKVRELIPELIKEHKSIHDLALANASIYAKDKVAYGDLEAVLQDHMYKEETWIFSFMRERGIFDERSEEIASQHQEITSMLKDLESVEGNTFAEKYSQLIELLQEHHAGEEEHIFPKVLDFIGGS